MVPLNPGKAQCSKFRSTILGGFGPQTRNERFKTMQGAFSLDVDYSPSPSAYEIQRFGINKKSRGGKMGYCKRKSFIDDAKARYPTPGPGNYQAPSDFGHYKRNSHSLA